IHQGVHRRVHADAQGQRHEGHAREGRGLEQRPDGQSDGIHAESPLDGRIRVSENARLPPRVPLPRPDTDRPRTCGEPRSRDTPRAAIPRRVEGGPPSSWSHTTPPYPKGMRLLSLATLLVTSAAVAAPPDGTIVKTEACVAD